MFIVVKHQDMNFFYLTLLQTRVDRASILLPIELHCLYQRGQIQQEEVTTGVYEVNKER